MRQCVTPDYIIKPVASGLNNSRMQFDETAQNSSVTMLFGKIQWRSEQVNKHWQGQNRESVPALGAHYGTRNVARWQHRAR